MALTFHFDPSVQPVDAMWNGRDQTTLVSTNDELIRTAACVSPANRGMTTDPGLPDGGPFYRTPGNGIGSKSATRYDGSASHQVVATLNGSGPTGFPTLADLIDADAFTIMMIFKATADAVSGNPGTSNVGSRLIEALSVLSIQQFTNASVQELWAINNDGGPDVLGPVEFTRDIPQLATFRHVSGDIKLSVNGGTEASMASGDTTPLTNVVTFGFTYVWGGRFTGQIGEIKIWDTNNADGALNSEQNQLMAKWGIRSSGGAGAGKGNKGNKGGGGVQIITPGGLVMYSTNPGIDISST